MSLQTPRALTPADEQLLRGFTGAKPANATKQDKPAKATKQDKPAKVTKQDKPAKRAAVDWAKLKHARGSAKNVPDALARLTEPRSRARALGELREAFVKKGEAFQASGALFGALVDLASGTERGEELLSFAMTILALGDVAALQTLEPTMKRLSDKPLAKELRRAAEAEVPRLEALLDDSRAPVRGMAAMLLGFLAQEGRGTALAARLASEKDTAVRARMIFAAMYGSERARRAVRDPRGSPHARRRARRDRHARSSLARRAQIARRPRRLLRRHRAARDRRGRRPRDWQHRAPPPRSRAGERRHARRGRRRLPRRHVPGIALRPDAWMRHAWETPVLERWFPHTDAAVMSRT